MALKLELEQWQHACEAFDARDYDTALRSFYNMADNAKMHFNIGLILAALEDHERAVAAYSTAIAMDPYFAVAYFQMGVSHFVLNDMEAARRDFDLAYEKLRGNPIINYQQLGLAFRLYGCEVLFNRGICQLYLGKIDAGLTDLYHAQKSKMTEEHDIIDQAVRDRGRGYSVYSIPTGVLYRPPEARLQQMRGINMFAAIDKLHKLQQGSNQKSGIKRNNSVLLPQPRARQPVPFQPQRSPTQQPIQTRQRQYSAERKRKDSNVEEWDGASQPSTSSTSSFGSRYTSRRVDSGFDEDRYSSSSASTYRSTPRSSSHSHTKHRVSPPPVPPIPRSDSTTNFDQELDEVYGSLQNMSVERDRRCGRERLNSSSSTLALQPSTSTSSSLSSSPKIKCKVHYTDCRILLVPAHTTFDEFLSRIRNKLNAPEVRLQYKDEDDELVLMIDDDDLHMARQIARARASPDGVERLEIWCVQ